MILHPQKQRCSSYFIRLLDEAQVLLKVKIKKFIARVLSLCRKKLKKSLRIARSLPSGYQQKLLKFFYAIYTPDKFISQILARR